MLQGLGVWGLGLALQGSGCRVLGLELRVKAWKDLPLTALRIGLMRATCAEGPYEPESKLLKEAGLYRV